MVEHLLIPLIKITKNADEYLNTAIVEKYPAWIGGKRRKKENMLQF